LAGAEIPRDDEIVFQALHRHLLSDQAVSHSSGDRTHPAATRRESQLRELGFAHVFAHWDVRSSECLTQDSLAFLARSWNLANR
jgi:hypothetical protein